MLSDPGLARAMPTGEHPRTWVPAMQVAPGAERSQPWGVQPPRPPREGLLSFFAGTWMPRWARGDGLERRFGGVAVWGLRSSLGWALHAALSVGDALVVTDRRLVVVKGGALSTVDDSTRPGKRVSSRAYRSVWSCRRADLAAARRRGRLTGRGRVELYFADASLCAVTVGVLRTSGARRLLAALALPDEPPAVGSQPDAGR